MRPSEIIDKINSLNIEIESIVGQLFNDKENPQVMDVDLLNQKLIALYDLALKLRYNMNVGEPENKKEEDNNIEYFRFEPVKAHFVIETDEPSETNESKVEPIEEKEAVKEPEIVEEIPEITETKAPEVEITTEEDVQETPREPVEEIIPEQPVSEPEVETPAIENEQTEPQPEVIEEILPPVTDETPVVSQDIKVPEVNIESEKEVSYWTVESGWKDPGIEKEFESKKQEAVKEVVPEPVSVPKPAPEKEPEVKTEPAPAEIKIEQVKQEEKISEKNTVAESQEKKPIFESVTKSEKTLNEIMAENKEKSVLNEAQKLAFTDFKSAITLNLKISFIRELFQGNEKEYKKMIDFLTRCENFSEAKLYLQGEKEKHPEWDTKQELLSHLQELINRKFL